MLTLTFHIIQNQNLILQRNVSSLQNSTIFSTTIMTKDPVSIYLLKVNNRNTRTRSEICSKLTIKTPERRQWFTESDKFAKVSLIRIHEVK